MVRPLICTALIILTSGIPSQAAAKKTIVLLDFGGEQGLQARKRVLKFVKKTYNVYPSRKLIAACERLGIQMKRGEALSRCARELRAVAVVGGTIAGGKLHLVVYSGNTGEPLHSGSVGWSSPPSTSQVSEAFRLLASGLSRAPAAVSRPRHQRARPSGVESGTVDNSQKREQTQPAPPPPAPSTTPQPLYDPGQIGGPDVTVEQSEDNEPGGAVDVLDPLGGLGLGGAAGEPYETEGGIGAATEGGYIDPDKPGKRGFRRNRTGIRATAGFGALIRRFGVTQANQQPPSYDSGLAMGLRFALVGRPLAFLYDDWVAGFFLRLQTDLSVGLRSTANVQGKTLKMGTSILELLVDLGWEWLIFEEPDGPRLAFSVGFGLQDFSVNWPTPAELQLDMTQDEIKTLPDAAYRFALLGVGGTLPFADRFAAYLRANYRIVFGAGEIEDEQRWYGSAFVGGIGATVGARANFHGFVASLEYGITYYFYSFTGDRAARLANNLQGAKSASDQYHTAMLNLGYAY